MYAKVFSQMYDGTLCTRGPWQALVTFQQMLVLADLDGNVDMTLMAIARRTTIPLDILEQGLSVLLEPDPESRTPTEEGRRLVPLVEGRDWGWRVVNYKHYRAIKREEERREYHRNYWHKRKLKASTDAQHAQQNQPIAEAEAEAPVSKDTAPAADASPVDKYDKRPMLPLIESGVWLLREFGSSESAARSLIGKLIKSHGIVIVESAIDVTLDEKPAGPRAYLIAAVKRIAGERKGAATVASNDDLERTRVYLAEQAQITARCEAQRLARIEKRVQKRV